MAASGLPRPRIDHAQVLTQMALEMIEYVWIPTSSADESWRFAWESIPGWWLPELIGRKKFIYDLWGNVVNTASRMDSDGPSGSNRSARATYEIIKAEFACEPRGTVELKGLGKTETWLVRGRLSAVPDHQAPKGVLP